MIGLLGFLGLWGTARWFAFSRPMTLMLAAFWWLAIMLLHAPWFGSERLARVIGGDFKAWAVFGLLAAVVLAYLAAFRTVKARAEPPAATVTVPTAGAFTEPELNRYARHIILREIGGPGQRRLKDAKVLVIGAGGLGSPALLYLAASGVGTLGVVDDDKVERSNLQRQIIHTEDRVGMPKVQSAAEAIAALNPHVTVKPYSRRLDQAIAADLIADYDVVLDGSDNFDTRYLVNLACVKAGKPLVAGAITQWEGQLSVWDPGNGAPCYECVFPTRPAPGLAPTCAEAGVAAPLPGVLGTMMAMETLKLITGAGEPLRGRLLIHDALYAETRVIGVQRRADCPVCGGLH
jgi:molybdopterin/thiamine biosynthesis adenylyltransferase